MNYSPILVSVYNRFSHFKKCIDSLRKNELAQNSILFIVSDAPYREEDVEIIDEIRLYVRNLKGFRDVHLIANELNKGSVKSIFDAREYIFELYDRLIFMEDDIEVSPNFLDYMNGCLDKYESYSNVFAVSGYNHPLRIPKDYINDVFFLPVCPAWGIGYWKDKHQEFDEEVTGRFTDFIRENEKHIEGFKKFAYTTYRLLMRNIRGELISGDTRKSFYEFSKGLLTVIPVQSLTKCNGNDGSGEHSSYDYKLCNQVVDTSRKEFVLPDEASIDSRISKLWSTYFNNFHKKRRMLTRYYYYLTKGRRIFYRDMKRKYGE